MKIREIREEKGITQCKLAQDAGIAREMVNRYERGRSIPDTITLIKIAKALDTSIDSLVSDLVEGSA